MLYLTVNDENEKTNSFYKAVGAQHASQRAQSAEFLVHGEELPSDVVVVRLHPDTAAYLLSKYCCTKDLSLPTQEASFELLTSSDCEGTYLAIQKSDIPPNCVSLCKKGCSEVPFSTLVDAIRNDTIPSYGAVSLWKNSALKTLEVVRATRRIKRNAAFLSVSCNKF